MLNLNAWSSFKNPRAVWVASFDSAHVAVPALLRWLRECLAALEESGIYHVGRLPAYGYEPTEPTAAALFAHVSRRFDETGRLDLFYFSDRASAGHPDEPIGTRLAYFGPSGAIVEAECRDLAALQVQTRPWLREELFVHYHRKPFLASGLEYDPAAWAASRPTRPYRGPDIWVQFSTFTDIWLPAVEGANEKDYAFGDAPYPNVELHERNGSRLREAIRRLKASTTAAGGEWAFDADESYDGAAFRDAGFAE